MAIKSQRRYRVCMPRDNKVMMDHRRTYSTIFGPVRRCRQLRAGYHKRENTTELSTEILLESGSAPRIARFAKVERTCPTAGPAPMEVALFRTDSIFNVEQDCVALTRFLLTAQF